jgi:radical SAM superfamily enzyme YgiQ (UPF0313 family)
VEGANQVLDEVSAAGVLTKCYFIIGFPWETRESLAQLRADVRRLRADEIKATFYVPFPGTRGFEMHRNLLSTTDWSQFTTLSTPVVRNAHVPANELIEIRRTLFREFYTDPRWAERANLRVEGDPDLEESFREFAAFLQSQGIVPAEVGASLTRRKTG